ncbi:MAG: hypothetical protein Q8M11_19780 [Sulfuritalea sp.]|nr:hypothetical protein [Sulfuritalea sp.]MDP1985049.1 hypothetical protein [Sulfuritalea sp.]
MSAPRSHFLARRQRGITLITTTVMLVMVMLLGVSAVMLSRSEFRLAGNLQFRNAALNDAETALSAAEQWVANNNLNAGFATYGSVGTPWLYPIGYLDAQSVDPLTMTWNSSNSLAAGNSRYLIERIGLNKKLIPTSLNVGGNPATGCTKVNIYRIVARGESLRGTTRFIQSIYSVLSC